MKISVFRDRQKALVLFFFMEGDLVACCDVDGLMMSTLNIVHDPHEWRLFIDSSKTSVKAVLLHNGNLLPSIPVGHSVHLKETYDYLKQLLKCIDYEPHQWPICGDLKVVALLLGLQGSYTKYCCFICKWDSRARAAHYVRQNWPMR